MDTALSNRNGLGLESAPRPAEGPCTAADIREMIGKFGAWLERAGYAAYDPYDLSGTRYGKWTRRLYYDRHALGALMAGQIVLLEIVCPGARALFVKKNRYATAEGQLVLAFLNLHQPALRVPGDWLAKARDLAEHLLQSSIGGYAGHCWGYPFDWQHANGLMPKNTPHITATPYCFEAFLGLFDATGDERYLEVARSTARFVHKNLRDTQDGPNAAASSYTPNDNSKVVNASAYRAWVMFEAAARFGVEQYAATAWNNLRFILQRQREDGAWMYAIDDPKQAFIDNFHTCFVLKNLYKINRRLANPEVAQAIRRGYAYYRRELFDGEGWPKTFALEPRRPIVRLEMYNIAEGITLGSLLADDMAEALPVALGLAALTRRRFQVREGYFLTRIYRGGIPHKLPFIRWPQAQMFYAMTNLLKVMVK